MKSTKFKQGKFTPNNPSKYKGDVRNIIYRSSWELKFLLWCDRNSSIIEYSSEETVIPYRHAVDDYKVPHRYFVDFKIKYLDKSGKESVYLVEIKPLSQTLPPVKGRKRRETYINECATFEVNQSKWKAAREYASQRGWNFIVLTEKQLGIK